MEDDYHYAQYLQNEEVQTEIQKTAFNFASTLNGRCPEISENDDANYAYKLQRLEVGHEKKRDKTTDDREKMACKGKVESFTAEQKSSGFGDQKLHESTTGVLNESEEDYLVALQIQEQINYEQQEQDLMLAQRLTDEHTKNQIARQRGYGPDRYQRNIRHRNPENRPYRDPESGAYRNLTGPIHTYLQEGPHRNSLVDPFQRLQRAFNTQLARDRRNLHQRLRPSNHLGNNSRIHYPFMMPGLQGMMENDIIDLEDYDSLWDLAEQLGDVRNSGASREQIAQLPVRQYKECSETNAESKECLICITKFNEGETLRTLPCLHTYHKDCVDRWLQRKADCPVCRKSVKEG